MVIIMTTAFRKRETHRYLWVFWPFLTWLHQMAVVVAYLWRICVFCIEGRVGGAAEDGGRTSRRVRVPLRLVSKVPDNKYK